MSVPELFFSVCRLSTNVDLRVELQLLRLAMFAKLYYPKKKISQFMSSVISRYLLTYLCL